MLKGRKTKYLMHTSLPTAFLKKFFPTGTSNDHMTNSLRWSSPNDTEPQVSSNFETRLFNQLFSSFVNLKMNYEKNVNFFSSHKQYKHVGIKIRNLKMDFNIGHMSGQTMNTDIMKIYDFFSFLFDLVF